MSRLRKEQRYHLLRVNELTRQVLYIANEKGAITSCGSSSWDRTWSNGEPGVFTLAKASRLKDVLNAQLPDIDEEFKECFWRTEPA